MIFKCKILYFVCFCNISVQVTNVELQKNGNTINTDNVEVNIGIPTTLGCKIIPSTSRPSPTVIWYMGTDAQQNSTSTSYTVTATESDHDKIIYCKAYNRPWNQPVESAKPKLFVRGKVENSIYNLKTTNEKYWWIQGWAHPPPPPPPKSAKQSFYAPNFGKV